jgi:sec-independent protein translocase protein TatB
MAIPTTVQFASLGMADSLILMVMALVVFGPRRLPEIGRRIGKLMYEFRKASNDFKFQMEEELRSAEEADRQKKDEVRQQEIDRLLAASSATPATVEAPQAQVVNGDPHLLPPVEGEQVLAAPPNNLPSSLPNGMPVEEPAEAMTVPAGEILPAAEQVHHD